MGRKKGVQNKITVELKDMILGALDAAGGSAYLLTQARKKNPAPFLQLVGKCLPKDMHVTATVTLTDMLREVEERRAARRGQ